jgi:hypothetical protein
MNDRIDWMGHDGYLLLWELLVELQDDRLMSRADRRALVYTMNRVHQYGKECGPIEWFL